MGKRLYRLEDDKFIAGICSGIADYFRIDPTIIRLAVLLITLFAPSGAGMVLAYIIAWMVIPTKPNPFEEPSDSTFSK